MLLFLTITIYVLTTLFILALALLVFQSVKEFAVWLRSDKSKPAPIQLFNRDLDKINHWHLYALKLEHGKYYIGITSKTPEIRMQEHINKIRPAYWTAMHTPLEIINTEDLGDISERRAQQRENKVVRDYMKKYGINNVRGGDLTSTDEFIKRFGLIMKNDDWFALTSVVTLLLVGAYFAMNYYILKYNL